MLKIARALSPVFVAAVLALTGSKASAEPILIPSAQVNASDVIKFKSYQMPAHPKIGLALGGGGSRGAALVGVLEVLDKEGLQFDYIAGTSVGAIVGGLYDAGVSIEQIKKEFLSGRAMRKFSPIPVVELMGLEPIMFTPRLIGLNSYDGLYPGWTFHHYLEKLVPGDNAQIQDLKIPFAAVSLNLIDGKPYMIRGGSIVQAMRASSAVPGLRKPIQIEDKLFVDGGPSCNLPVKQCREMGADFVIAVDIDEPFNPVPLKHFRKPGSVSKRMLKWSLNTVDVPQQEIADIVIHPDASGVGLITTNRKAEHKAYEAGKVAAEAMLPKLRDRLTELGIRVEGKVTTPEK